MSAFYSRDWPGSAPYGKRLAAWPGFLDKLSHLRIFRAPNKSTLSYADNHRPRQVFEDVFKVMPAKARSPGRDRKKRLKFKNPLYSIDSRVIDLCLEMFDRVLYKRTKGAIKLRLTLERQSYLPCRVLVSDYKTADVTVVRAMSFPRGAVAAMDRGCVDFNLFPSWTAQGVYFVTRVKERTRYGTVEARPVPAKVGRPRPMDQSFPVEFLKVKQGFKMFL